MARGEGACLVCGKPLVYYEEASTMKCHFCGREFKSHGGCEEGHYVCDECHEKEGVQAIMEYCSSSTSKDPVWIIQDLMENPYIYMHGPEHHILVGAALLTAYHNCGGQIDLEWALKEMQARGSEYPGGACGLWGCCGAAVSTGMFVSIVTKATPLTGKSWKLSNQMTSQALAKLAELGGPRCCKRNSFTSAKAAVEFTKKYMGVEMRLPEQIQCDFSEENQQCLRKHCPYYKVYPKASHNPCPSDIS